VIEVSNASWHARLYLWWYYAKWPKKRIEHEREGEGKVVGNLCPYVRTVLFWAPCRWLFYQGVKYVFWIVDAILAIFIVGALVAEPIRSASTCAKIGWVLALLLNWLLELADERWHWVDRLVTRRRKKRYFERITCKFGKVSKVPKGPSFWSLIGQRVSAAHDRICPEIHFRKF
jgi:hypothetical protein